jgi:putative iron-dependent peroxidase
VPLPQTGIFALGTNSHAYLEFDLLEGVEARQAAALASSLREPRTTIAGVNLVVGFRPELCISVAPSHTPQGVTGFNSALVGPDGYTMPASQHDIVMWLSGAEYDVVFDLERNVVGALMPYAKLAHEMIGWPYHHDRDLTGFIDGTENPTLVEATRVAIIADGQPGEGGSILLLQKWEHDVSAWENLGTERQELAMGRRKSDSEELDPKPQTSHVGRTDQDDFGKIFRRNIPFGDVGHHGTIFVGFAASQEPLARMLDSMLGVPSAGGQRDELTRFTQPTTGAYYFIPSTDALEALAPEPTNEGAPSRI